MSKFTDPLIIEDLGDYNFKLVSDFEYWTNLWSESAFNHKSVYMEATHLSATHIRLVIIVPKGFVTNFASVPRFAWSIFPPYGKHGKAAVIHDYLYEHRIGNREWADKVFYEAMKVLGVPWWRRKIMYWAVSLFGGKVWKDDKD